MGSAFIGLGHKLVHAFHNDKGLRPNAEDELVTLKDKVFMDGLYVDWDSNYSREEWYAVFDSDLSENTLRAENGLPFRRF